jgi:predicted RNase H-like nuclease (RuvC/YqgF family)
MFASLDDSSSDEGSTLSETSQCATRSKHSRSFDSTAQWLREELESERNKASQLQADNEAMRQRLKQQAECIRKLKSTKNKAKSLEENSHRLKDSHTKLTREVTSLRQSLSQADLLQEQLAAKQGILANRRGLQLEQRTLAESQELLATTTEALERIQAYVRLRVEDLMGRNLCMVCLERSRCMLFEPCSHLVTCEQCSDVRCPLCRAVVKEAIKVHIA